MTPQSEALSLLIADLSAKTSYKISVNALPVNGGISVEVTGGELKCKSLDYNHRYKALTLLLLCKDKDQQKAFEQLCTIENYLDTMCDMPKGELVQITSIDVKNETTFVSKLGDFYIYSLIIKINIYF